MGDPNPWPLHALNMDTLTSNPHSSPLPPLATFALAAVRGLLPPPAVVVSASGVLPQLVDGGAVSTAFAGGRSLAALASVPAVARTAVAAAVGVVGGGGGGRNGG